MSSNLQQATYLSESQLDQQSQTHSNSTAICNPSYLNTLLSTSHGVILLGLNWAASGLWVGGMTGLYRKGGEAALLSHPGR